MPILELIAEWEVERPDSVNSADLAEAIGAEHRLVRLELDRLLEQGLIVGTDATGFGGVTTLVRVRLGAEGARIVGVWPSADPYDALLALLDERLLDPGVDEDEKSSLRKFRDSMITVGPGTLTGVLSAYAKSRLGL